MAYMMCNNRNNNCQRPPSACNRQPESICGRPAENVCKRPAENVCNRQPDNNCMAQPKVNCDNKNDNHCGHRQDIMMPLAMAYVPWQRFVKMYELDVAFVQGTVFPELDKPFLGNGGMCR